MIAYIVLFIMIVMILLIFITDWVEGSLLQGKAVNPSLFFIYERISDFQLKSFFFLCSIGDFLKSYSDLLDKKFTKWEQKRLRAKRIKKIRMERFKNDV
jgi:hypothetical protein